MLNLNLRSNKENLSLESAFPMTGEIILLLTHRIIQISRYIRGNSLLPRPSSWLFARDAFHPSPVAAHDSLTFSQSPITRLLEIFLILLGQFRNSNWKQISHTLSWKNDNALSFKFIILSAQCEDEVGAFDLSERSLRPYWNPCFYRYNPFTTEASESEIY